MSLNASSSRKRPLQTAVSEEQLRENKRFKDAESTPHRDKKRRRKKKRNLPVTAPGPVAFRSRSAPQNDSQNVNTRQEMHKLNDELDRYRTALKEIVQCSLTCQICLDLLYRPYALTPCGHITCYSCLVRWFTTGQDAQGPLLSKKKTCPHCRTVIRDRPVEVWEMKRMVEELLKTNMFTGVQGSIVGPSSEDSDPWKNIFPKLRLPTSFLGLHHIPVEDIGILDAEDGGIYRCMDCMHEIWGDGICSGCQRRYPAHLALTDPHSDDAGYPVIFADFTDEEPESADEDGDRYEQNSFIDDSDSEDDHHHPIFPLIPLLSDNDSSESEEQEVGTAMAIYDSQSESGVIELTSDEDEGDPHPVIAIVDDESSSSEHSDSEDEDDEDALPLHRTSRVRNSAFIIQDDSGDSSEVSDD